MAEPSPDAPGRAATLRAVVLTAVLIVHGIAAAPLPHVVTPEQLQGPVAREEVARWAARLTALGCPMDAETFGQHVVAVSGAIGSAHRAALAPVRPVFAATGTGQGWALFANPDVWPSRLEILVRRSPDGPWERLARRLDPEAPVEPLLRYRRVRGVYESNGDRRQPRAPYRRFATWYADRLLAADPTLHAVEVRMVRTHTTVPPAPPDGTEQPRHSVIRERAR